MSGKVTVLSPINEGNVVELGRKLFRKQLLPKAKIDYLGRELNFDDTYLDNVAQSFRDQAFDTCPLVMADAENRHTMSPAAATGTILGVERTADGLDILVEANDAAARVLSENPRVGVSARIVEDFSRADGRSFQAALQHALITFAPRIPGLRPWEPVECSEETTEVMDLSALTFTPEGDVTPQATQTPTQRGGGAEKGAPVAALTEEELAAMRAVLPIFRKFAEDEDAEPVKADTAPEPPKFVEPPKAEEKLEDTAPEPEKAPESQLVAAADDTANAVELALIEQRTQMDRMAIELAEAKAREDAKDWAHESAELVRDYGIPPAIVQMAEPLLKGRGHTVELAEGSTVDAGQVLRSILATVAKTYGRKVDLSGPVGTAHEMDAEQQRSTERDEFLARQRAAGFATH